MSTVLYKAGVLTGQSKWFALSTPLRFAITCFYLFLFVMLAWVILANDNYKFPSPPSFHIPFIGRPSEWASDHGINTTWVGLIVLVLTWVGVVKIAARNQFGNSGPSFALTSPASTSQTNNAQVLFFKSSESAFEAACKYGGCDLKEGAVLVAIVLDTREIIGGDVAVKTLDDGRQRVSLLVCAADGGFSVIADTPSPYGPKLEPGNLVSWRIGGYSKEAAEVCGDQRCGWVGLVTAKLKPEYSIQDGWKVDSVFGVATTNSPTPARAMELAQYKESPSAEPKPNNVTKSAIKYDATCPNCGQGVPSSATECRHCRTAYIGAYRPRIVEVSKNLLQIDANSAQAPKPSARYGSSAEGANRFKKIVMFCVIAAMAAVVGKLAGTELYKMKYPEKAKAVPSDNPHQAESAPTLLDVLRKLTQDTNKKLPILLNKSTRLDHALSGANDMTLFHTILDSELWKKGDLDQLGSQLPNRVCSDLGFSELLGLGATITYVYRSNDGRQLFSRTIHSSDCGNTSIKPSSAAGNAGSHTPIESPASNGFKANSEKQLLDLGDPSKPTANLGSYSPSFECKNANSYVEVLICSDEALAGLDREMASLYSDLRRNTTSPQEAQEMRAEQLNWLANSRNTCTNRDCLLTNYRHRISRLSRE